MEKDTWNFKSMTDDDPMDFGFESPANKKKNAFKMDIGFDLEGDFGNLSSFKMDMPDFDISSPAKKTTKTKESSDDKSSEYLKQKKNPFAFSYDFDAVGDFDLDSSPPKKGRETTTKTMDCEEISPRRKIDTSMANTDVKAKASVENENETVKSEDTVVVDGSTFSKQATLESMESSMEVDSPQGPRRNTSLTQTMCVQFQSVSTSPLKTSCPMVEEIDEPSLSNETAAPSPLHATETVHIAINRKTSPGNSEICRSGTKEGSPKDPERNANNEMISAKESSYDKNEQAEPNISSRYDMKDVLPGSKIRTSPIELVETDFEIANINTSSIIHKDNSNAKASSLTQKLSKNLTPGTRPLQKSKIVSLQRSKLETIMSGLRAVKTLRTIGVNKDQPSFAVQAAVISSISKVKKTSEIHHLAPKAKTKTLQYSSSLKRKALDEDVNGLLKPQRKRFSVSPKQRNLEIPITDNIEKAEAYRKELKNMCNILKKKHEEAKELLVRAVVNNNKLLMLNHPLYKDKIRMVQKLAAKLNLRNTQTTVA